MQRSTRQTAILLAPFAGSVLQFRGSLIRALAERGMRTTVLVPTPDARLREGLARLGSSCEPLLLSRTGLNALSDMVAARALERRMREIAPHLVIATGIKSILYGIPAAARCGVPARVAFFTGLGGMMRPTSPTQRVLGLAARPLVHRALRASSHVVTQNQDDTDFLTDRFAAQLEVPPLTTPGSGVDLDHFLPAGLPAEPSVLMLARIVPEKGVREYLAAAKMVRRRHPAARFVIAGMVESRSRGIGRSEFLAECEASGVEYLGEVPDVRPLLRDCSVFVLPSYYGEGRPRSIQEALAMGRPVVTTDNPGCRDSIGDGVHGRVIPVRDHRALAGAIVEVLDCPTPELRSAACRLHAEQTYCARKIARDLLIGIGL